MVKYALCGRKETGWKKLGAEDAERQNTGDRRIELFRYMLGRGKRDGVEKLSAEGAEKKTERAEKQNTGGRSPCFS